MVGRRRAARSALLAGATLAALLLGAEPAAAPPPTEAPILLPPPGKRIYHAANPDFGGPENRVTVGRIRHFERISGRRIAWAYFSNNWRGGVDFPAHAVARIRRLGRTPFVRLMARSDYDEGGPDERYSLQSIIDGRWDGPAPGSDGLRSWCRQAAAIDGPLLAEFGTEVNGAWFPWNGRWNGGGERRGYGNPALADGPERFRDAYRHIVDLCRDEGADNITWFFHVNADSQPRRPWNRAAAYYPGDDYVDWIGVSFYGSLSPRWGWEQLRDGLDRAYPRLARLAGPGDKPLALLEYGTREDPSRARRKARWIRAAARDIRRRYPRLDAAAWWNEKWNDGRGTIDVRIDSSRRSLRAFRRAVAGRRLTSRLRFGHR